MKSFRRNQLEEAATLVIGDGSSESSQKIRSQIKRLLDADRRSAAAEQQGFAFISAAPQGKGREAEFTGGDAFSIVVGLQMLRHRWHQGVIVRLLRSVKGELRRNYDWILKQDAAAHFSSSALEARRKPGAVPHPPLMQLVILSEEDDEDFTGAGLTAWIDREEKTYWEKLHRGQLTGRATTVFELSSIAFRFAEALSRTTPTSRGRKTV